jgi:hypothetical protein
VPCSDFIIGIAECIPKCSVQAGVLWKGGSAHLVQSTIKHTTAIRADVASDGKDSPSIASEINRPECEHRGGLSHFFVYEDFQSAHFDSSFFVNACSPETF